MGYSKAVRRRWLLVPAGVFAGACMTLQARLNAALTGQTHDAALSATLSFAGGLIILALAVAFSTHARARFALAARTVRNGEFPWWLTVGGAAGAFYVFSQGQAVPAVGIAIFTVAYVAAQTFGSFLWDHFGIGPSGAHAFSLRRIGGAVLAVAAVLVTFIGSATQLGSAAWLVALPLVAGLGSSWQQIGNGRVQSLTENVVTTTFWNFLVGFVALSAVSLVRAVSVPHESFGVIEWWMLLGGPVGVVFIAIQAEGVRHTGALLMTTLVTFGQLGASLLSAALVEPNVPIGASTYVGVAIAAVSVVVTVFAHRHPAARSTTTPAK